MRNCPGNPRGPKNTPRGPPQNIAKLTGGSPKRNTPRRAQKSNAKWTGGGNKSPRMLQGGRKKTVATLTGGSLDKLQNGPGNVMRN
eukprot:5742703-Pyramimonas_sp.AAC.1